MCIICGNNGYPICKWCTIKIKDFQNKINNLCLNEDFDLIDFNNYTSKTARKTKFINEQNNLLQLWLAIQFYYSKKDCNKDKIEIIKNIKTNNKANTFDFEKPNFIDNFINEYLILKNLNNDNLIKETNQTKEAPNKHTNDFRKRHPATIHCQDGHYVRSSEERAIDDYLYSEAKLLHSYEPKFRLTQEEKNLCNEAGTEYEFLYPDFYIPEFNLYIEFFGINDQKYNQKMELKIKIFQNRKGINFRYLTYKDSNVLLEKLEDILNEFKK